MANYIIDLYAINGSLFHSELLDAPDNIVILLEANAIALRKQAATFKIIRLEKEGNVLVQNHQTVRPEVTGKQRPPSEGSI